MATQEERNARLDKLSTATSEWATKRRKYLNDTLKFAKNLLKGRKGTERLNNTSVQAASDLVVDELGKFLAG